MAVYRSESPLFLSGDNSKDIETLRNYLYERDMDLRYILEHLDGENFVAGFSPVTAEDVIAKLPVYDGSVTVE